MSAFLQDFRYALRTLKRSAGLTLSIVASLAIGIGANTAIFSVVNALLLKPLPYPDPDRLAVLWLRSPGINIPQDWPSPGQYIDIQNENHRSRKCRSRRAGAERSSASSSRSASKRCARRRASSTCSARRPLYGRLLLPEDDVPGKAPVVVLSHAFWRRLFNADPNVVGRSITINGVAVGRRSEEPVHGRRRAAARLPAERRDHADRRQHPRMDVFLPLPLGADAVTRRGDENYNLMARLKPGVTMAQAQADVVAIADRIREKDKRDRTFTISVVPLLDQVVGDVRPAVLVLLGSVALVLLIACANVANLLLTRATAVRRKWRSAPRSAPAGSGSSGSC